MVHDCMNSILYRSSVPLSLYMLLLPCPPHLFICRQWLIQLLCDSAATKRLAGNKQMQKNPRQCCLASQHPWGLAVFLMLILHIFLQMSTGTSSPQSLKKILALSEEGSERHRRQPEDTMSNASSQLSSPPTSPQSSPKKGKPIILPPSDTTLQTAVMVSYNCHLVAAATYCTMALIVQSMRDQYDIKVDRWCVNKSWFIL